MEVPKATLDHHNRKKTAVGGGGGVAAIGAVLLLGGALATAAFFRKRGWNSGKDRRRRLQDQKDAAQDGSFGATEEASNVPKELSGAVQAAAGESTQRSENPRVEIEGGILIDGCDCTAEEQSLGTAILGNDAVSASTNEDETLHFEAENMMNGGELKVPLIKEDNVSDEVEIKKCNNVIIVYDGDVGMKCEHGVEELQVYDNRGHQIEDHGENGGYSSEEANGDEKEHATKEDSQVESVVGNHELVEEKESFCQGGDAVGPKDELVPEDIAIGIAAESPVVDEDEPLMKCDLCLPTSHELGGLSRSFDNKGAEEDLILHENIEDKVEDEEVKENNVVGQQEGDMVLPENVEDEVEEEEPAQVVGQSKQHEDNVEKDTADEVEFAVADDVAMRASGDTDHSSEVVAESSLETSDSCTDTQHLPDIVVEETSLQTGGSGIDDSDHSSEVVIDDSPIDSKSETILPTEALHETKIVEAKTEGDGKGFHTIPYSGQFSIFPENRVMKKYMVELVKLKTNPTRRAVAVGTVWLWCSWFFGLSLVKLCAIVALTMAVSKIQGY